jgi:anti-sigma B factor antagonist
MEVKIDVRAKGSDVTLIVIRGEIGTETVDQFKEKLEQVINDGKKKLVIDLQEVNYLNSMGLGVFASALKKLKKGNGDLKLINLSPTVMELLERSRLDKVFDVFETEEEAVKSFG